MIILKPEVHETIWGGKKLTPYSNSTCEKIGHLYSVNCNENETNTILNGEIAGKTLNEYFDANKVRFGLEEYEYFPVIVALVEAQENLSIQVHPDDDTSAILNSKRKLGKNESWFFIEAPETGYIFDGCTCKDMKALKRSIVDGKMEDVIGHLKVKTHDYVYVVAGTLHAMSAGALVYEIEENAGCTYRFYDFNRIDRNGKKRELQIPEAFFSIDLEKKSEVKHYSENPIDERRYITQYYENVTKYSNTSKTLQVFTVISGECEVDNVVVRRGMSIILEPQESLDIKSVEAIVAQPKRITD